MRLSLPLLLFVSARALSSLNRNPGVQLTPSSSTSGWFDTTTVAYPVVIPPTRHNPKWQCYYYGRGETWKSSSSSSSEDDDGTNDKTVIKPFLPTGWIGRAESDDGLTNWVKQEGTQESHSLLAPTGNANDWDGAHLGLGDVVVRQDVKNHNESNDENDILDMFYFGGSDQVMQLGPTSIQGLDMQIGRAKSTDGGRTWQRLGLCLERDADQEGLFCGFPQVSVVDETLWLMVYHTFDGQIWTAYSAVSEDKGETWRRCEGPLLEKGNDGAWDDQGVGCRSMIRIPSSSDDDDNQEEYLMIYEGVASSNGRHRLGVAHGTVNQDGKLVFTKDTSFGDVPGGPVLASGEAPLWNDGVGFPNGNVGTPYLALDPEDGSLRLYFVCIHEKRFEIGCVVSPTGDPTQWEFPTTSTAAVAQS